MRQPPSISLWLRGFDVKGVAPKLHLNMAKVSVHLNSIVWTVAIEENAIGDFRRKTMANSGFRHQAISGRSQMSTAACVRTHASRHASRVQAFPARSGWEEAAHERAFQVAAVGGVDSRVMEPAEEG